jgi:hypothetical protein
LLRGSSIIIRIKGKIRKEILGVCLTEEEFMKRMWDVEGV